jgi:hypothetical protein
MIQVKLLGAIFSLVEEDEPLSGEDPKEIERNLKGRGF